MFINTHLKNNGWQLCFNVQIGKVDILLRRKTQVHEDEAPQWYVMWAMDGVKKLPKALKVMYTQHA